ncbi:MAG: transcriptional regulator GcvA [Anaerolineales bacterium]|nr:transcriptional regulator GcvA [Anaerolineales bacterium]
MKDLPPLNALRAFEAAARLCSIRKAASELLVTPGAVSRQIQGLEAHLGLLLFRRKARSVSLSAEGERYYAEVSRHLRSIADATRNLVGPRGVDVLKIRAYTTFAMKWLIPRLSGFHAAYPQIQVRLTTALEEVDFEHEDIDGAIRLGDGKWPGFRVHRLVPNRLVPVCSPQLQESQKFRRPVDLRGQTLLHSLARPDDWSYWLKAFGVAEIDAEAGLKYQSSAIALQAAIVGHGVFIAQSVLVESDLASGLLVSPLQETLDRGEITYYLVYPPLRTRNRSFVAFRDWLVGEAETSSPLLPNASPAEQKTLLARGLSAPS